MALESIAIVGYALVNLLREMNVISVRVRCGVLSSGSRPTV